MKSWNAPSVDRDGYIPRDDIAARLSIDTASTAWAVPPRLPVPDLDTTCRNYLTTAEPLLTAAAFARTRSIVADFLADDGPKLQQALETFDRQAQANYLHNLWRGLYLSARAPLPVLQNVAGGFALPRHIAGMPLADKAACIAFAATLFLHDARSGRLPQDRQSGRPLCMLQYSYLSGTTRIPDADKDRLRHTPELKHCLVAWRGGLFVLPLAKEDRLRSPARLRADIGAILNWTEKASPIGLLTGLPREDWAARYRELMRENAATLEMVETAAFILCIDEPAPTDTPIASWFFGRMNRWFDKTLQIIVSESGTVGCNIEHSALDGLTFDRFARFVRDIFERDAIDLGEAGKAARAMPLAWHLPDRLAVELDALDRRRERGLDSSGLNLRNFAVGISGLGNHTNPMVQLALQIASRRVFGRVDNIYQPVHMRHYRAGRTEAAHPVTQLSIVACSAFLDGPDAATLRPLVMRALRDIGRRILAARRKGGVDRHLSALRHMAELAHVRPAIFDDPAYGAVTGPARICTSAMPAGGLDLFAFAPARRDGYGVAYVVGKSDIAFCVTGWAVELDDFCAELRDAMSGLTGLLTRIDR